MPNPLILVVTGVHSRNLLDRPKITKASLNHLWVVVLDRLYCNLNFPRQVLKAGGHFLTRSCSNTTFVPDPARPARESRDAQGHRIVQEWGWLGKAEKADRQYMGPDHEAFGPMAKNSA